MGLDLKHFFNLWSLILILFIQTQLWHLAQRTTTLPFGRGAFTLGTICTLLTEVLLLFGFSYYYNLYYLVFFFFFNELNFLFSCCTFVLDMVSDKIITRTMFFVAGSHCSKTCFGWSVACTAKCNSNLMSLWFLFML